MNRKPGARLKSVTDTTEVVVVRGGDTSDELCCGGQPMIAQGEDAPSGASPAAGFDDGTQVGKRYEHSDSGLEVLCTKAGPASLSVGSTLLTLKDAKPLPSSD